MQERNKYPCICRPIVSQKVNVFGSVTQGPTFLHDKLFCSYACMCNFFYDKAQTRKENIGGPVTYIPDLLIYLFHMQHLLVIRHACVKFMTKNFLNNSHAGFAGMLVTARHYGCPTNIIICKILIYTNGKLTYERT